MRRLLLVFLLFAIPVDCAQVEPAWWYQFFGWLSSLDSGDVAKHTQFLKEHAAQDARMHHPFRREAIAEMELRDRVGGGLTQLKTVNSSDTEIHSILKSRDEKGWVEVVFRVSEEMGNKITAIELRQIAGPNPEIPEGTEVPTETETIPVPRLYEPDLLSPRNGAVFNHFPRYTTVSWTAVPGAAAYRLEWDFKDGNAWHSTLPNATRVRIEVEETNYTFAFVGAQMGRWRVCAIDEWGVPGPQSEWREFRYTQ